MFRIIFAAALGVGIALPVSAQTGRGGFASATISGLTIEGDATASIAASIGYRLDPIVTVGVELTFVPSFRPHVPDFPSILSGGFAVTGDLGGAIFPQPEIVVSAEGGRATIFTGNLRLTIPTSSARVSPYVFAGAGVGNVRDEFEYTISYRPVLPVPAGFSGGVFLVAPAIFDSVQRSTTDFAMTLGGGVSVLVSDRWSIDADVRYFGIAGERDIHTGRYGTGIAFRF